MADESKLEKVYKTVFGNGEIGITEMIRNIWKEIGEIKKFMEEYREDRKQAIAKREAAEKEQQNKLDENQKWLRRAVLGPALAAIVMLLINGIIFIITWAVLIPVLDKLVIATKTSVP